MQTPHAATSHAIMADVYPTAIDVMERMIVVTTVMKMDAVSHLTVEITAMKMDVVCVVMYTAYLHTCIMPGAYEPHKGRPLGGS